MPLDRLMVFKGCFLVRGRLLNNSGDTPRDTPCYRQGRFLGGFWPHPAMGGVRHRDKLHRKMRLKVPAMVRHTVTSAVAHGFAPYSYGCS